MPYKIQRRGSRWVLKRVDGTIKSRHSTKAKAEASEKIILAKEHGWRPKKRR